MLQKASDDLAGILVSKGCDDDLRALENMGGATTLDMPTSGCTMAGVTRSAFALSSRRIQLAAIHANGTKSWLEARATRIVAVEGQFNEVIRALLNQQLRQAWVALDDLIAKLTALISREKNDDAYQHSLVAAKETLVSPLLTASFAQSVIKCLEVEEGSTVRSQSK